MESLEIQEDRQKAWEERKHQILLAALCKYGNQTTGNCEQHEGLSEKMQVQTEFDNIFLFGDHETRLDKKTRTRIPLPYHFEQPERYLSRLGAPFGSLGRPLATLQGVLGEPRSASGALPRRLGSILGKFLAPLGVHLGPPVGSRPLPGAILAGFGGHLGPIWVGSGALGPAECAERLNFFIFYLLFSMYFIQLYL